MQLVFGLCFLFFWMFVVFMFYLGLVALGFVGIGTPLWFLLKGEEDGRDGRDGIDSCRDQ